VTEIQVLNKKGNICRKYLWYDERGIIKAYKCLVPITQFTKSARFMDVQKTCRSYDFYTKLKKKKYVEEDMCIRPSLD